MLAESKDDDLLAFHSVRLFAGLCVAEIRALDWRDVDLAGGFIHVGAKISKTRSRRLVPILDNLKAWLQPIAKAAARAGDSDWPSKTDPDLRVLAGRRGGRWLCGRWIRSSPTEADFAHPRLTYGRRGVWPLSRIIVVARPATRGRSRDLFRISTSPIESRSKSALTEAGRRWDARLSRPAADSICPPG